MATLGERAYQYIKGVNKTPTGLTKLNKQKEPILAKATKPSFTGAKTSQRFIGAKANSTNFAGAKIGEQSPTQGQLAASVDEPTYNMTGGTIPQYSGLTGVDRQRSIEGGVGIDTITPTQVATPTPTTPAPTTPAVSTPTYAEPTSIQNQITALSEKVASGYSLTPTEMELQRQATELEGAARMGMSAEEGQGRLRELNLIRGRQGKIGEQANLQLQTLTDQLANAQAQRTAEQQADLVRLGYMQDQQKALTPFESQGALVQYDPTTGQINTLREAPTTGAEGFTLGEGQVRYDSMGNVIASGLVGETVGGYNPNELLSISDAEALGVQYGTTRGQAISMGLIPGAAEQTQYGIETAQRTVDSIDKAISTFSTIPSGAISRVAMSKIPGTNSYDFAKLLDTIKSNIGFNEITAMREASKTGGALGQVSERELTFLQSVLGSLDIGQSEEQLAQNLDDVKASIIRFNSAVQSSQGEISNVDIEGLQNLLNAGQITQQEYNEYISFSSDLSASGNGSQVVNEIQSKYSTGDSGGQCGRFVNNITGIGMGDSFENKMSFTDPSITVPRPGDVFVMPYDWTGHTGVVIGATPLADGTFDLQVADSNWSLDERVKYHNLNSSLVAGYARA